MQPLKLTLKGFRGIRDGLGLEEITLDLECLAGDAELIAIAGANGSGKTTIMDNLITVGCGRAEPGRRVSNADAEDEMPSLAFSLE